MVAKRRKAYPMIDLRSCHVAPGWTLDYIEQLFADRSPANEQAEALAAALAITGSLPTGGPPEHLLDALRQPRAIQSRLLKERPGQGPQGPLWFLR
jgi:hypothetical protein